MWQTAKLSILSTVSMYSGTCLKQPPSGQSYLTYIERWLPNSVTILDSFRCITVTCITYIHAFRLEKLLTVPHTSMHMPMVPVQSVCSFFGWLYSNQPLTTSSCTPLASRDLLHPPLPAALLLSMASKTALAYNDWEDMFLLKVPCLTVSCAIFCTFTLM